VGYNETKRPDARRERWRADRESLVEGGPMKRDMDLVRRILMDIEACPEADAQPGYLQLDFEGHSTEEVMYHVQLLGEAGLIETQDQSDLAGFRIFPQRLTWQGHEFLDAIRKDTIWEKAKSIALEKTGALGFEALKVVSLKLAADALSAFTGP
jgi:hypothetical protein